VKPLLILASQSPRRRQLLRAMGVDFKIIPSKTGEATSLVRPAAIVKALARRKALSVARQYPRARVIGADTLVVCKGRILGKPKNRADALRLLKLQNASWQSVYTGVSVAHDGKLFTEYEVSRCKARRLSDAQLLRLSAKHHDKAGAYAVQDDDDPFIEKIAGNRDNVVGLPCCLLKKLLAKTGFKI